jgi:hypothetical protein
VGIKGALKGGNIGSEKDKKLHEGLRVYMGQLGQATGRMFLLQDRGKCFRTEFAFLCR